MDTTAVPGVAYTYKLVEKEVRGRKCVHGPYTVTAEDVVSESSYAATRQMNMFSGPNYYSNRGIKKFKRESRKKGKDTTIDIDKEDCLNADYT